MILSTASVKTMKPTQPHHWSQSIAGALAMAVAMGFGRFAFTPMYPLMLKQHVITLAQGSWLAALNYAGYLAGSLMVTLVPQEKSGKTAGICLLASVLCLWLMGQVGHYLSYLLLRLTAGALSASAMVAVSTRCLQTGQAPSAAPTLYAGVGAGILLSSWLIELGTQQQLSLHQMWSALSLAALVLSLLPLFFLWPAVNLAASRAERHRPLRLNGISRRHLIAVYAIAGFGYIVSATYLPVMLSQSSHLVHSAILVWSLVGAAAIPSCHLWHRLLVRSHLRLALCVNLLLQAVGVVLPVLSTSSFSVILAALCLGGGFMGTVAIAMPAARQMQTWQRTNLLGVMTFAYAAGQIAGPVFAQATVEHTGNLYTALTGSALALCLAALSLILHRPRYPFSLQSDTSF